MIKREARKVSVIIPAYKAESFIYKSLEKTKNVLDGIGYEYEVICVVDGKFDKTFEKAKKFAKRFPKKVKVVGYENNLGKGHAVRYGMAHAEGDIVAFIDAGLELKHEGLSMLLAHFEWYDADIIIGSKRHPASKIIYPWQRKVLSFGYQVAVRLMFGLNVRDTQVGMKFFRREVLEKTTPRLLVKAFAFDIEMLAVAHYLGFKKIYEAPVELKMLFNQNSTISTKGLIKTAAFMLWDTLTIFYRLKVLNFYHYNNRSEWVTPKYLTLKKNN